MEFKPGDKATTPWISPKVLVLVKRSQREGEWGWDCVCDGRNDWAREAVLRKVEDHSMGEARCGNCRFYLGDSDDGVCRRFPPVYVPRPADDVQHHDPIWRFPELPMLLWCGEHQPIEKEVAGG